VRYGEKAFNVGLVFADPAVFTVFDFPLLAGNPATALEQPNAVVITEKMAKRYFGNENPLGKSLNINIRGKVEDFVVTAVAQNLPDNSSIQFEFLLPTQKYGAYERNKERWTNFNGSLFIQLAEEGKISDLERKLAPFVQKHFGALIQRWQNEGNLSKEADAFQFRFQPLHEISDR
jgi:hypothetical protein